MAHELDLTDCTVPASIAIYDLISAALDAGDYEGACLAILAHPASVDLDQKSIRRLWLIGNGDAEHSHVDRKMIEVLASYVETAEGLAWNH